MMTFGHPKRPQASPVAWDNEPGGHPAHLLTISEASAVTTFPSALFQEATGLLFAFKPSWHLTTCSGLSQLPEHMP